MALIDFQNVTKTFSLTARPKLLRGHILHWMNPRPRQRFTALKDVSFRLEHGESLAVIGRNGAGKSTLLSLVAGLARPDAGSVLVSGRVAALLELGSGFHPDLTGAENLLLNASLLGLSRRRTRELFDQIVEFSGIGDFIHQTLRTYSTGMAMRLAFSVAIQTRPDLLLIDEILAVGDAEFQAKCAQALSSFRREGGSMLVVSHALASVSKMCEKGLWLDHGEVVEYGEIQTVLDNYGGAAVVGGTA